MKGTSDVVGLVGLFVDEDVKFAIAAASSFAYCFACDLAVAFALVLLSSFTASRLALLVAFASSSAFCSSSSC